jgi:hypothetical protein
MDIFNKSIVAYHLNISNVHKKKSRKHKLNMGQQFNKGRHVLITLDCRSCEVKVLRSNMDSI